MTILLSLILGVIFATLLFCLRLAPSSQAVLMSARVWRQRTNEKLAKKLSRSVAIAAIVAVAVIAGNLVSALAIPAPSQPLGSLKKVPIPEPSNLGKFVKDRQAAIRLGKALFWDMQVGSDGIQACATCHFHAGVDNRSKNQIHPGPDTSFNIGGKPNYQLKPEDFPLHKLTNVNDRSSVQSDRNDVIGSQGVTLAQFIDIIPGSPVDQKTVQPDPVFNVNSINVRQVTGRNAPTAINAVFNHRNFWDGRAQNEFNGQNPFGLRDTNAFVLRSFKKQSEPVPVKLTGELALLNASLASQAVGPPLNAVEESATGRIFPDIGQKFDPKLKNKSLPREKGKKLKYLKPLGKQLVASDDSVLGPYSNGSKPGLKQKSYEEMIKDAFKAEWWDSQYIVKIGPNNTLEFIRQPQGAKAPNEFELFDYNFPLFMGLSIQLYESKLVSDNAPIDQYYDGNNNALTPNQKLGKELFEGKGKCINCHGGPEFTNASVRNVQNEKIERMHMANNQVAVYDNGFYNIGVRPTAEDLGVGGKDPFGNPLSFTKYTQQQVAQGKIAAPIVQSRPGENIPAAPLNPNERVAVDGAFKVPGLRNVELTAPYFHNGGTLTLRQVVDFYNRGGDFHEQNIDNLDPDIENLGLTDAEKEALVDFMKALTDERVRKQSAPFDHPELFIPNGHPGDQNAVTNDGTGQATDALLRIPAVGRNGDNGTPNFLQGAAAASVATPSYAPGAGYTQEDCPAGTSFRPLPGGFVCQ